MPEEEKSQPHNMLKEIYEQPEIIRGLIKEHVDPERGTAIFREFRDRMGELKSIRRIIFLGCGTSYNAALYGNYVFEELAGINCEVELCDEFIKREAVIEDKTAVILLSQSGETADILKAARNLKSVGVFMIGITNVINSSLTKLVDVSIYTLAGEEKALAATKTFTSELIILVLLAVYFGGLHRTPPTISDSAIAELKKLPEKMAKALGLEERIKIIAEAMAKEKSLVVLGEKYSFPIALEAALKFKETTYIHAEGVASGEFKHGPLAIIDQDFPVIVIAPKDTVIDRNVDIVKEIKNAGGRIITITTEGVGRFNNYSDSIIYIQDAIEILTPIFSVIAVQLLSYHIAIAKGIEVDRPRNIRKFVG